MKTINGLIGRSAKIIALLTITFVTINTGLASPIFNDGGIILNPEYQIKRMSNGEVIVYSKKQSADNVKHTFTDLYADLLLAIYRKQSVAYIESQIAKKYYLSDDDCRREIKHAVNVLAEWNIVLRNDQIASR
jgi:hypothetical protein